MKKLAFLLALITSITACSLAGPLIPAPLTLSTTASVPVTNTDLHVSFRQPDGWALISSGILKHIPNAVQYATYGLKGQPYVPTFTITRQDVGGPTSQDGLVRSEAEAYRYHGAEIIEELREIIDGIPAGGVRYSKKREVGFELFVTQRGQTHTFQWTSDVEYLNELEQIYRAIVPTIKIEPPPP